MKEILKIDAKAFLNDSLSLGLGFVDRSVYRELVEAAWRTESMSILPSKEVTELISLMTLDIAREIVLKSFLSLSSFGLIIRSSDGSIQVPKNVPLAAEAISAKKPPTKRKREVGGGEKSLRSRAKNTTQNAAVKVSRTDTVFIPDNYCGWMPTNLFEKRGEIAIITDDFINILKKRFKKLTVENELTAIFTYLKENKLKRRSIGQTAIMVSNWMERRDSQNQEISRRLDELLDLGVAR